MKKTQVLETSSVSIKVSRETYDAIREIAEEEDRLLMSVVDRAVKLYANNRKRR